MTDARQDVVGLIGDGGTSAVDGGGLALSEAELRTLYAAYRRREARALVGMLPREAVRPLYRKAHRAAELDGLLSDDPMAVLVEFCETLLPLPPFDIWLQDLHDDPSGHWSALETSADVPTPSAPATLATRPLVRKGEEWVARLRGFRDPDAWRGFIAFQPVPARGRIHRTTLIFRERTLEDLRARFRGFDSSSLEAFLRSALP